MTPLKEVDSSLIHSHGYDHASRTLAIVFRNGGKRYEYRDVPPDVAEQLDKADSAGKAFGTLIRGKFDHTMVSHADDHEGATPD